MKNREAGTTEHWVKTAKTLSEALPYMRQFAGETFVIKYGGHAMGEEALSKQFARDVILMKQVGINPIIVHGGGPQIGKMLDRLKISSSFVDGLRVTDAATVEIVEMVLCGSINKQIVTAINEEGGKAIGLSGKDANLITAKRVTRKAKDPDSNIENVLDLGFVGEPEYIDTTILDTLYESDIIPVIAPIGIGRNGETYNINADTVAGALAAALEACKLIILTDVSGVLDKDKNQISELTPKEAHKLVKNGTISGGMIPKIDTCVHAVENGCRAAHILDGRVEHVILIETFTSHGAGTMIVAD
ncbi:MAG: acetylglutamate kinase [Pseudomonadota bacterium]